MPFLTPISVLLGVTILSEFSSLSFLVKWIFAFISFASCIGLKVQDLRQTLARPMPILVCLFLLQILIPIIAYGVGNLFFSGDIYTITGLVLAFTIPTGVISLMWVAVFGGNRAVTLAIVLINTILSPILVPFTLKLLVGAKVSMDSVGLMNGLLWMIVIPSLLGLFFNKITKEKTKELAATLAPFSKLGVMVVIIINSAVVAPYFRDMNFKIILLGILVFAVACFGYFSGLFVARILKWDQSVAISLMFNCGMRNNGVGAALAITYFPAAVAFPVVITIIFQQFLASLSGKIARSYFDREEKKHKENLNLSVGKSM